MRAAALRVSSCVASCVVMLVTSTAFAEHGVEPISETTTASEKALDRDAATRQALVHKQKKLSGDRAARELKSAGASAALHQAGYEYDALAAALHAFYFKDLADCAKALHEADLPNAQLVAVL